MSKTRKLFLVLLSLCFAVAMSMSFGIVGFAADETPVTVSAVDTVASEYLNNGFTMRVDLTTDAAGLPGGALDVNGTARYFRNGASAALGTAQSRNGSVVKLYFKDATGLAFTNGVSEVGDILVVDAGFSFSNTSGTAYKVEGNLVYEFDGSEWAESSLPDATIAGVAGFTASTGNSGYPIRLHLNTNVTVSLGNGATNLVAEEDQIAKITYTRGDKSVSAGVVQGHDTQMYIYFRTSADLPLTLDTFERGDIFSVGENIVFSSGDSSVTYVIPGTVSYIYNGTAWVPGSELPSAVQITWPEAFGSSAWVEGHQVRVPSTGLENLSQHGLAYDPSMLSLVTVKSGDSTYTATHIYEEGGLLTFFFNGSGYDGQNPADGDVLSVGAGLSVSNKNGTEYVNEEAISWTYMEEYNLWVCSDVEVRQITWPDTFDASAWVQGHQVRVPSTGLTNNSQHGLTYDASMLPLVTIASGETKHTATHIYEEGGLLTFFFNGSGYDGQHPTDGDVLSVGAGLFVIDRDGLAHANGAAVNYTYSAEHSLWVRDGAVIPDEPDISELDPIEIESVTVTDVVNGKNTDSTFFINSTSSNTQDFGDADYTATNIRSYITFTFPSGTETSPWYVRVNGRVARLFIRQENNPSANINNGQIPVGGILTIKAGFRILETEALQEDVSYIFDGTQWIEGTELPDVAADFTYAQTQRSGFENNGFTMRVDVATNAADLGPEGMNLDCDAGMNEYITYTRGTAQAVAGVLHRDGAKMRVYFKNPAGASFTNGVSQEGDILTIKQGFEFRDVNGITYVVSEDVSFRFDGGAWIKADGGEYPDLVSVIATGAETNSNGNSTYPIVVAVNTTAQSLGGFIDMQLTEDLLSQVTYTRNGVSVNAVYAYSQSKSVLFWFRGTNGLTMAEDSPEPGDTITIGEGFRFVSNDNRYAGEYYMFGEPLTYMFDGVAWVTPREIPDRDYASLTPITIDSVSTANPNGSESDTVFYITTTSSNDRVFDNSNYDDVYTVLPYFSFVYPNGNIADVWCARVDGKVIRLYIHEPGSQSNIGMATMPEGGVLTIRAGFGILNTEALQEDVSYVYNGTGFVALNAPSSESDYEITTPNDTHIKVGQDLQIEVKAADGITAYFRYAVNNKEIATISSLGVLRGLSEGTVTVSVWYGNLPVKTVTIIVDPLQKEDIDSFEIVTDIDQFIIPVNGDPSGSTNYFYETVVERGGYVLMGQYTLTNGVKVNVEITADMIGKQDFAEAGNYAVIITDPLSEMTAEIEVEVINQRVVGTFSSLGVSGYDVDDSRNASGTWNGHMMVGMDAFSTNTLNMTGKNTAEAAVLRDMSNYIVYEDAKDGVVYQNTYDEQGKAVDTPISLWQLGSRYLVLIRPNGYSGTKGYGVIDGEQIPIYRQGDKITFKAGMPAYKFIGNADNTAGYYIVEGVRESDITYYCYEDNGTSSLWQLYIEYTDFTVSESIEIEAGAAQPIGAVRVPADATTGTFTYQSSDPSVVTINEVGTMIGMSTGEATITITLTGGKDENGEDRAPITKEVKVTVVRGISKVEGSIEVRQGEEVDLSQYSVVVTYTDGTTEEIKLNDERVVMDQINTDELGTLTYRVSVTINGTPVRGTLTVNVVAAGGCSSAVGAASAGIAAAVLLAAGAILFVRKKKLG